MATRSTFSLPVSRFTTACVPRPPQPTRPAFRRSFDEAPRARARPDVATRNVRRENESEECIREHLNTPRYLSAHPCQRAARPGKPAAHWEKRAIPLTPFFVMLV